MLEPRKLCFFILLLPGLLACKQKPEPGHRASPLWIQKEGKYNNYRIPSLIVSQEGTLLAFAEGRDKGDTGDIDILLKRSGDGGKTWGEEMVVWDDADNTCGNPCPVVDRNTGRIFLFMTWNSGRDHESDIIRKKSSNTRIPYLSYSDDDGLSWSEPENLFHSCKDENWGWYATGPGIGIQMRSPSFPGRMIIPCNNSYDDPENSSMDGFNYGCHVLISDDGGANWRMSSLIAPGVNESQLIELEGGVLMMNMRSYHGKASRAISYSHDGGESWSEIRHHSQLIEPVCQASTIYYGNYKKHEICLFSNPSHPGERRNMSIKSSLDGGRDWSQTKTIYTGPSAYSCLARLPDGNIGLLFECGEKNPYETITFVSIPPEELNAPGALLD